MVQGTITPESACEVIGGKFNTKKSKCNILLDDAQDTCKLIGGNYDFDDETCDLPMDDPTQPASVTSKPVFVAFFVLQVLVGSGTTIIAVWYSPTDLPPTWWTSYVILGVVYFLTVLVFYYKFTEWKEAFARASIALITVAVASVVTGWLYYWDISLYWGFVEFAGLPIAATIPGIVITSLLSIVIVDLEKRKGDDPSNDFSGGSSISIVD